MEADQCGFDEPEYDDEDERSPARRSFEDPDGLVNDLDRVMSSKNKYKLSPEEEKRELEEMEGELLELNERMDRISGE